MLGSDFKLSMYHMRNRVIRMMLWDPSGPGQFRSITTFSRGANIIFVLFDTTDSESNEAVIRKYIFMTSHYMISIPPACYLGRVDFWLGSINPFASESVHSVLVGTKIDLVSKRTMPYEVALAYATAKGLPYFEVSCKTGQGVDRLMNFSIKKWASSLPARVSEDVSSVPSLPSSQRAGNNKCVVRSASARSAFVARDYIPSTTSISRRFQSVHSSSSRKSPTGMPDKTRKP